MEIPLGRWLHQPQRQLLNLARKRVITDYREFCSPDVRRRALLSYLVHPLLPPPAYRERVQFSNRGIAQQIARALNELGYVVDIVDYQNCSWTPHEHYDLFVGHGGFNFEQLCRHLDSKALKVYFSTGIYWRELNVRAAYRTYQLALRQGYLLPPERYVDFDEEYANRMADGIICLGNAETTKTYAQFPNVFGINNGAFPVNYTGCSGKNYESGRAHFLFFSGRGNVHRGLDLLLEAFSGTDLHLYICQHIEPEFARVYKRELTATPNIHLQGFIKMRSPQFETLAQQCNWVILPTCAEGQPGSVIECMAYGLVPVLPDSASIDLDNWGVRIPDLNVETIRSTVLAASTMDPGECRRRSERVAETTQKSYSVESFRSEFKTAILEIAALTSSKQQSRV